MIRNVLIIEDMEYHMDRLCAILADIPEVNVLKAYNMEQAYCMLSSNTIHLFLVDIILNTKNNRGDVSGLEIVQTIRQNKSYEFTPVIFVTSLEDPKLFSYSELHCYGYIEKPFDADEVKRLIKQALNFPVVEEDKYMYLRKEGIIYPIKTKDIVFVQNIRYKTRVKTVRDEIIVARIGVSEMVSELNSPHFIMCSRNTIVNKEHIEYVDFPNRYIKFRDIDEMIEIAKPMIKKFREMLKK